MKQRKMAMLCFVLDLRNLSPTLLRDLKQLLSQLGNYYAVSSSKFSKDCDSTQSKPLLDRIGLCYVFRDRISCSDGLKIAYNPHGNFNLRDFHHAVNNLPTDAFSPESNDSGALYLKLADVLSDKILYTWGGHDENVARKLILISSCPVNTLNSVTVKALMDAAEKCVLVEFVFLEQTSHYLGEIPVNINFIEQISSLTNCSFRTYIPEIESADVQVLSGLAKRWFQELKDDREEPIQARFVFKINLNSTLNQISCNLCPSCNAIDDGFIFCRVSSYLSLTEVRCMSTRTSGFLANYFPPRLLKSLTKDDLGDVDIIDNSVKVGEQTILYMPSFQGSQKLQQVSSPIDFNVIQRTNLGSLSEGLIMGATYFITPSTFHDPDENDKSELNSQLFQVVCSILHSLDQGLVCSSYCNIETATKTSFQCYYILLPSDKGLMLLRRLSAAEEFLPIPDVSKFISSDVVEEIRNTVQASLLKMEVSDYNPVQHERGFHQKLNLLVKESLQFGAILPKSKEGTSELDLIKKKSSSEVQPLVQETDIIVGREENQQFDFEAEENNTSPSLTKEWEQLIVTELGGIHSPTLSNSKQDQLFISSSQSNKQLDEKTSRILERLEIPRQLKRKSVSPTISNSFSADVCAPAKKPLIPYGPDKGPILSQPLKPNFQRMKKKR
ncbi:hypothetical protein ACJIZ3_004361 [Penstemon smallii]|uniref:Uncharacterized protein n=1 Tax=Penstemon smallii TaxID=265156 RepID=A0ABD3S221_9LAMI